MLHDTLDDCNKTQLNHNLRARFSKTSLDSNSHTSSQVNLLNASNESLTKSNKKCTETNENLIDSFASNRVKSDLLATSNTVEKLSWKFFEQVDSLDNQLRSDVSTTPAGLFLKSAITDTAVASPAISKANDVSSIGANSRNALGMHSHQHIPPQTQAQLQTVTQSDNRKSNGYANNGTIQTTEIFSQTNGPTKATGRANTSATANDLNCLPQVNLQQLEQPTAPFVFTSPTSTFKRKKQKQLLKEEQEVVLVQQNKRQLQEQYNNNVIKIGTAEDRPIGTAEGATTLNEDFCGRTALTVPAIITTHSGNRKGSNLTSKQQQHTNNTTNDKETVINNSLAVALPDTGLYAPSSSSATFSYNSGNGSLNKNSNGNESTRFTFKTHHTLPAIAITSTNSTFITDGVVDLVAKHSEAKLQSKENLKHEKKYKNKPPPTCQHCHKMQVSSSGGSGTTTTAKGNSTSSLVDDIEMHLGLIGWRKKCLYILLLLLMLLIIINLGLTLWILKVMDFSTDGMGQLKIVPGGIQLTGQALIMDMLRASTIRSRHGQPIAIESSRNFSINTRDANGMLENQLFLGHDKLECMATSFRINDTNGRNLFSVNRNEVTIGAHALRIDGEGGAIFRESIQTPHVRAEPARELRLESPTRQLEMTAAKDINLQSRAGGIEISALKDVKLTALDGSIRFETSKIFMPNLRTVQLPLPGAPHLRERQHGVYQLCACANGKLFLTDPHSICAGDDTTVCR